MVSEEKSFESMDGRRTTEAYHTTSSPGAFGSGELKNWRITSTTCMSSPFDSKDFRLHLENSKSKKGHNFVKKNWKITSPTGISFPFDSEQLF